MKRSLIVMVLITAVATFSLLMSSLGESKDMPFGGDKDVEFARSIWTAMEDYQEWPMRSGFYPGESPHGKVLRMYYNLLNVNGTPYHVIVKDNYGGSDATVAKVSDSPDEYLGAVTIMVQKEKGYDPDNDNWFWAKYLKNGELDKNAKGLLLAGRVAKGMNAGCIACHKNAKNGDYLFSNDD